MTEAAGFRHCATAQPHEAHDWIGKSTAPWRCPGREDFTRSKNVTVRWQAQLEEHLRSVRSFTHEAVLPGIDYGQAALRSNLAQANALAALALAVGLASGDLEVALSRLTEELHGIG